MYNIHIGDYIVSNVTISLNLKMKFKANKATFFISLPENYPKTVIGTNEKIKEHGLFYAKVELQSPPSNFWKNYSKNTESFINQDTKMLTKLTFFYSYVKDFNIEANLDEQFMLSGLGKKTICIGFLYMINYYNINPNNTPLVLTADGGQVRTIEDKEKVKMYSSYSSNDLLKLYKEKFPYDDIVSNIAYNLVALENNEKLIFYYKNAYGFKKLSNRIGGAVMQTLLSTFMSNC